jgi:hypothetical protein
LDHVLIFGERHLRRVLTLYSLYYNESRTHLGLAKDAPLRRAVQRCGTIAATQILSGPIITTGGYNFREGQPCLLWLFLVSRRYIFNLTWHRNLTSTASLLSIRTVFIVLHTANGETLVSVELLSASMD